MTIYIFMRLKKGDYEEAWVEDASARPHEHKNYNSHDQKSVVGNDAQAMFNSLAEKYEVNPRHLQIKMDVCILTPICLLYLLAYLDRLNISNANVYGMSEDLHMNSMQYSVALAVFFVPYVIFEVPANWLLKFVTPHVMLSLMIVVFGCVSISQGFVKNYHGLVVCRILLGFAESAMLPACYYLLGSWYTRAESQKRYSFFFSSTSLAGAFGGLIAYGMNSLDMKQGLQGWRWLYIVEGSITAFCGVLLFFMITDFPETAKFLKPNERDYIKEKLAIDQGDSNFDHTPTLGECFAVFKDPKISLAAMMYFGLIITIYGYAYFSISIIKTFDYSDVQTQIHSIYPWLCTFGANLLVATLSDLARHRYLFTLFCSATSILGLGLLLGTDPVAANKEVRYAACFLISFGVYCAAPILVCWTTMNLVGHTRKMVGSGFTIAFGNIGGIIATFAFKKAESPGYHTGLWCALGTVLLSMVSSLAYLAIVYAENRKKRRSIAEYEERWIELSPKDRHNKGELNPDFWYMY